MLRLYRRHRLTCPQTSERYRRCACPIYVEGTLAGEYVRKALDLTSWTAATDLIAHWNEGGEIGAVRIEIPNLSDAISKFFADAAARHLRDATLAKYRNILEKRLLAWWRQSVPLRPVIAYRSHRQFPPNALTTTPGV